MGIMQTGTLHETILVYVKLLTSGHDGSRDLNENTASCPNMSIPAGTYQSNHRPLCSDIGTARKDAKWSCGTVQDGADLHPARRP